MGLTVSNIYISTIGTRSVTTQWDTMMEGIRVGPNDMLSHLGLGRFFFS